MAKLQPKTFRAACLPLLTCSWISGTAIIEYPIGRQRKILSNVIAIINILCYGTIIYLSHNWNTSVTSNVNNINRISYHIMNFINTVLCVYSGILSFRNRKAPERFIARMQRIDDTLEKFGVAKNYHAVYISHLYKILQMFIIVETVIATNIGALLKNDVSTTLILVLVLTTHHLVLVMYISDMSINATIECVGKKFQQLNELLEGYANKGLYVTEAERQLVYDSRTSSKIHRVIKAAKEIHLELTRVSQAINVMHGFQMLLSLSLAFLVITWIFYYTSVKISQRKINLSDMSDPNVLQLIAWFLFYVKKVMMIIRPCAQAKKEARKTGSVIYRLGDTSRDYMIRKEVQDFFLQITQHPVVFSANGFFDLDYPLIQRMIGTVTTYLVILIQVDDIKPTGNALSAESLIQALNISL